MQLSFKSLSRNKPIRKPKEKVLLIWVEDLKIKSTDIGTLIPRGIILSNGNRLYWGSLTEDLIYWSYLELPENETISDTIEIPHTALTAFKYLIDKIITPTITIRENNLENVTDFIYKEMRRDSKQNAQDLKKMLARLSGEIYEEDQT